MANLSAEVRHLVRSGAAPDEVVGRTNLHVYDADLPARFVTFVLVEIDARSDRLTLANAGHMPPLIRRAGGTIEWFGTEDESGLPLGIERGESYRAVTTTIGPGDVVVMFTDGVNEAMSSRDTIFGIENLRRAVAAAGVGPTQVGDAVLRALRSHVGDRPQFDDIALVCFGRD
jgi:serine phosphatase RsbU (regulator of sigma subunit)